jgi:hypothetical protein
MIKADGVYQLLRKSSLRLMVSTSIKASIPILSNETFLIMAPLPLSALSWMARLKWHDWL